MKKRLKKFMPIILSMIIGGLVGYKLIPLLEFLFVNETNLMILIFKVIFGISLAIYAGIIIHELGHLIFGLFTGYKFVSFRVANIILVNNDGRLKLKKINLLGTGGQCLLDPPDLDGDGNYPNILYNLGGGLFNLFFALLFLFVFINYKIRGTIGLFLVASVALGIFLGLTNLIPLKKNGITNDGYNIKMILEDKNVSLGLWKQLKVNALLTKGVRLKNMDVTFFEVPKDADMSMPLINSVSVIKVSYYMDKMEMDKAKNLIYELLEESGLLGIHKNELMCELVFLESLDNNLNIVDKFYTDELKNYIKATKKYHISRRRLLYSYELLINNDREKANLELKEFNKMLKSYPYKSEIESELGLIKLIDEKYGEIRNEG